MRFKEVFWEPTHSCGEHEKKNEDNSLFRSIHIRYILDNEVWIGNFSDWKLSALEQDHIRTSRLSCVINGTSWNSRCQLSSRKRNASACWARKAMQVRENTIEKWTELRRNIAEEILRITLGTLRKIERLISLSVCKFAAYSSMPSGPPSIWACVESFRMIGTQSDTQRKDLVTYKEP